jgi:AraC family transcriptional regulator
MPDSNGAGVSGTSARQQLAAGESFGSCSRRIDVGGIVVRDTRLAPSARLPRHAHAAPYICIVLSGHYAEHARDESRCAAGSVLAHLAGREHANRIGNDGARCVNVELDEALLHHGPLDVLAPFLRQEHHVRLPRTLVPLRRLADALTEHDDLAPLQVHAAIFDLLCIVARASTRNASALRVKVLDRVVDWLEADLAKPPKIEALAALAGLHPHHLMRAFRQQRGETVGGYVRRRRLELADAAMRTGELPLAEIALRAGFCDQSHFTRAYRGHFGLTPGSRRRAP